MTLFKIHSKHSNSNISLIGYILGFPGNSDGKELACNAGDLGLIPEWEDPLEKYYSSILAWRIPWTEEPGGLQSMRSQRIRHNWATIPPSFSGGILANNSITYTHKTVYKVFQQILQLPPITLYCGPTGFIVHNLQVNVREFRWNEDEITTFWNRSGLKKYTNSS